MFRKCNRNLWNTRSNWIGWDWMGLDGIGLDWIGLEAFESIGLSMSLSLSNGDGADGAFNRSPINNTVELSESNLSLIAT